MRKFHWTHVGIGGDCGLYPLVSPPDVARSLLEILCPLQSLCPALSSGVNHNATCQDGSTSHLRPLPAARPRVSSTTRDRTIMVEGSHSGDSLYYPIQWVKSKDGATWELLRVWGILVHPSPPVQAYLWTTSFIGRIFPGLHTG